MKKGKIIFLNGVTSAGKTTIAKDMQEIADENFYHMSNDMFQQMISPKFLRMDYWHYLCEGIISMYHTAKVLSEAGINIIIDGMILELPEFQKRYKSTHCELVKSIFSKGELFVVEVFCPLNECKKRTAERNDRNENQSQWQNENMAKDIMYFCCVNTLESSSSDCAKDILKKVLD